MQDPETHGLELHPQLVVGELQRPGDGLEIINQHAETQTVQRSSVGDELHSVFVF